MNKAIFRTVIFGFFVFAFLACENIFFDKEIKDSPQSNFDYLWQQVNDKYAFLEYKGVDWEKQKEIYGAKIKEEMSDEELFDVLAAMLNSLRDGHVNLIAPFNRSHYDFYLKAPQNVDKRLIVENYLKQNYYPPNDSTKDFYSSSNFKHNFIADGDIAYVQYSSFVSGILDDAELDYIIDKYKNTKGMILDIRGNGGGIAVNVGKILSRFTFEKTLIHTVQVKSGAGKDDFTKLKEVYIEPSNKLKRYHNKVAVLIDRGSYSASSFFALSTKAYDNIVLVGDTTGGGLGLPNGGQLPNGWIYRFSITRTLDANGENFESGVPPDGEPVFVDFTQDPNGPREDAVIEAAIKKLLNN